MVPWLVSTIPGGIICYIPNVFRSWWCFLLRSSAFSLGVVADLISLAFAGDYGISGLLKSLLSVY